MQIINKLFGSDKSKEFLETLPSITIKQFFIRIFYLGLAVSFVFFVRTLFRFIFSNYPKFYSDLNLGNPIISYPIATVLFGVILFFAYRLLNITFRLLKQQYSSLSALSVLKHTAIIAFVLYGFGYVEYIFVFLNNKTDLVETLNSFDITGEIASAQTNSYLLDYLLPSLGIILLVIYWIVVGVVEEILFRGGIYRSLRKISPRILTIIISAFIFSIAHTDSSILGHINIFMFGVIYAWYYEYKNNLMTITLLHFLNDAFIAALTVYLAALTVQHFF